MPGIITIAQGDQKYIEMAKMLALSLKLTNPGIQRAVISDAATDEFEGLYDVFIPYNETFGKGLSQKLFLDQYSPFEETLFIDSDCLVFDSLDNMLVLCRKYSFVVFGDQISSGEWYMDVSEMCRKFDLPSIPLFNGGSYYFKKNEITSAIFDKAKQLKEQYLELGFKAFRGSINEEPLIALAMAINKVDAVDDNGIGMRTPIGLIGALTLDILNAKCIFNKEGVIVEPAIMHFSGALSRAFHYKREVAKLKMTNKLSFLNKKLLSFIINLSYNTTYGAYVFCKRVVKTVLRKESFDYKVVLPVFSNL